MQYILQYSIMMLQLSLENTTELAAIYHNRHLDELLFWEYNEALRFRLDIIKRRVQFVRYVVSKNGPSLRTILSSYRTEEKSRFYLITCIVRVFLGYVRQPFEANSIISTFSSFLNQLNYDETIKIINNWEEGMLGPERQVIRK